MVQQKLEKPERRKKLEALLQLAGDGAIHPDEVSNFCMLADEELLYLWKTRDAGEHTCRYEFDGSSPCKRCKAEEAYYEVRKGMPNGR